MGVGERRTQGDARMGKVKSKISVEKYKAIRKRWDHEDQLLMSRTGAFLTANSILCVALSFQPEVPFQIGVAVVGLALSSLWLTTSLHSFNIIALLYRSARMICHMG
jgi:hypothetical protein